MKSELNLEDICVKVYLFLSNCLLNLPRLAFVLGLREQQQYSSQKNFSRTVINQKYLVAFPLTTSPTVAFKKSHEESSNKKT